MRFGLMLLVGLASPGVASASDLTIETPWMRYLLPSLPAAGYMVVHNGGKAPAVLTGAASPACAILVLHLSRDDSGMSMMMDVPSVTIPPGGEVAFTPGGYHLMCMMPRMKATDRIAVTLSFAGGAQVAALMPVYGAADGP